ncbi:MAG: hypothetical protein AAFW82_10125, partial [Pseudomonadota bacterium]
MQHKQQQLSPSARPRRRRKRKKRSILFNVIVFLFAVGTLVGLGGVSVAGFFIWKVSQDLPSYKSLEE